MEFMKDVGYAIHWILVIGAALMVVAGGFVVGIAVIHGFSDGVKATRKRKRDGIDPD